MQGRKWNWWILACASTASAACASPDRPTAVEWDRCGAADGCDANGGAGGAQSASGAVDVGAAGSGECVQDAESGITWTGDVRLADGLDLMGRSPGTEIDEGMVSLEFPGSPCGFVSTVFDPAAGPKWELAGMKATEDFIRLRPSSVPQATEDLLVAAAVSGDLDITGALLLPQVGEVEAIYEEVGMTRSESDATLVGWISNVDSAPATTFIDSPQGTVAYLESSGWSRDAEFVGASGYFAVLNVPAPEHPGAALTLDGIQLADSGTVWAEDSYTARVESGAVTWLPVRVTSGG